MDSHQPEVAALFTGLFIAGTIMYEHCPIGPQPYLACVEFCLDNKSVTMDIEWTYAADTSVYDYLKVDYRTGNPDPEMPSPNTIKHIVGSRAPGSKDTMG